MDRDGFREFLKSRKLGEEQLKASLEIAERFEKFILTSGDSSEAISAWNFSKTLIQAGINTQDNLLALARYSRFIRNNTIYVAFVELLDGAEAQPNLYRKVEQQFGESLRDEVFGGIGISPLGLPSPEKPFDMFPVLDRLIGTVGYAATEELLSACLRDLPDDYFLEEREKYLSAGDIDAFLQQKHQALIDELLRCQQEGRLFFAQEITDEVINFVKDCPETESGVRDGDLLYITKIPYNTKMYLGETDPTLKRYYACHCPWAREAIKNKNIQLNAVFCNCSGGFSKKPWEVIFGQPLKAEVLESALKGDFRCRFVVHLPEKMEIV